MIDSFLLWPFPSAPCMVKCFSCLALISQEEQQYCVLGKRETAKLCPKQYFCLRRSLLNIMKRMCKSGNGKRGWDSSGWTQPSAFRNHGTLRDSVNVIGHSGSIYLKIVIALRLKLQGSILELSAETFRGLVIFPSLQTSPGGEAGFWEGSTWCHRQGTPSREEPSNATTRIFLLFSDRT